MAVETISNANEMRRIYARPDCIFFIYLCFAGGYLNLPAGIHVCKDITNFPKRKERGRGMFYN
jgi:hypothetical protein